MVLTVRVIFILVSLVVQLVDGNQRIVYVSEPTSDHEDFFTSASGVGGLISDDEDLFTSGDGDSNLMCCVYGNCTCISFGLAVASLISNVLINITTDVMLSSLNNALNLENISIIGHNNPTVNCKKTGGVHFNICYNCIIQGITWDGCGTETEPGIKLSESSNLVIKNCSFQYSKGPAIILSGVSGHVNISHCCFMHNNYYGEHDATIHYTSINVTSNHHLKFFLAISNCIFTYNKYAKSLVHIEKIISKYNNNITFDNTKFYHNQGVPIYVVNQNIHLLGKVSFWNNTAEEGAGIYMKDHSTAIFNKNSDVAFIQNSANRNGGAVFLRNHSSIIFDQNSFAVFDNNYAKTGIIYSEDNCNVTFQGTCEVTFRNNLIKQDGSAIAVKKSHITFTGNSNVMFINNAIIRFRLFRLKVTYGATIYSKHSHMSFRGNSITLFKDNVASEGGAILSKLSSISFKENSTTEFTNNTAYMNGGAIYSQDSPISFEENSTTKFTNNTALDHGGAIYSLDTFYADNEVLYTIFISLYDGSIPFAEFEELVFKAISNFDKYHGSVSFEDNSTIEFTNNTGKYGGAISSSSCPISFRSISSTNFNNNVAKVDGGAILIDFSLLSSKDYSHIEFNNNAATRGGAIWSIDDSIISFEGFSTTVFSNNNAKGYGGAIVSGKTSEITFCCNSTVKFMHNNASFSESVYCDSDSIVTSKGNSTIIFNDVLAKWCTDICLPYRGQGAVTINGDGIVMCNDQKAFACLSEKCHCKNLEHLLHGVTFSNNAVVTIADTAILSSFVWLQFLKNVSIIGQNNFTVFCVNDGEIYIFKCTNLTIEGIKLVGCGRYDEITNYPIPAIKIKDSSVIIQKSTFQYLLAPAINFLSSDFIMKYCNFMNNNYYRYHFETIIISSTLKGTQIFSNCDFSYNYGGKGIVYLEDTIYVLMSYNTTFNNNQGASIHLSSYCSLHISGDILFKNNTAENGAGIYISDHSTVIFGEHSNVKFINNSVDYNGSAIFINIHSNITFEQNSIATFSDNKCVSGTIYSKDNSNVTFKATSQVIFNQQLSHTIWSSHIFY